MDIYNTTNVRDSIIREIASVVIPENTPQINSITLRNKMEGATHGNWGKFYPIEYRITICLPEFHLLKGYRTKRTFTQIEVFYETNLDFLAAVIGHEYYHAHQWTDDNLKQFYHIKEWLEVEAERYESVAEMKWRDHLESLGVYKAVATGERKC